METTIGIRAMALVPHVVALLADADAGELHRLGDQGGGDPRRPGHLGSGVSGGGRDGGQQEEQDCSCAAPRSIVSGHPPVGVREEDGEGGVGQPQDEIRRRRSRQGRSEERRVGKECLL